MHFVINQLASYFRFQLVFVGDIILPCTSKRTIRTTMCHYGSQVLFTKTEYCVVLVFGDGEIIVVFSRRRNITGAEGYENK